MRQLKLIITGLLVFGPLLTANADLITYSDRATWQGAALPTGGENFNAFLADILINPTPTGFSDGILLSSTNNNFLDWEIDTSPFGNDFECDVDGTARVCGFNDDALVIAFSTVISAFGADFSSLNDNIDRTVFDIFSGVALIASLTPPQVVGQTDQFWGFVATAGESITSIRTRRLQVDTFGIDNIEITAVPEPGTLALLGIGLFGMGLARRRQKV